MPNKTVIPYGDPVAMTQQAVGLFAAHMARNTTMNRLTGTMPKSTGGAEATLRLQTTAHKPIVRAMDLSKNMGDEITFNLLNPVSTKPIMGDRKAEGRGIGLGLTPDRLRINQARFPVDLGGRMTQIRSPHDLRALGRPVAQNLMDRYVDQSLLVHMAGARGFHHNIEWVVPLESDPDFADIMVNQVRAPSKNRHFIADGTGIKGFTVNAGEVDIQSTDLLKMDTIDAIRTTMEQIALPPPPVIFEGDKAATDSPIRVLLVSPAQYSGFATDPAFRQFQASAMARANQAGGHPLFMGEAGLWNGILIVKMPKPIRFYAGDPIKYAASTSSETESVATVPAALGSTFAVDRAILLGGQAVAEAFGSAEQSGIPFFWNEELLDHKNAKEIAIGTIRGVSKIRYAVDAGNPLPDVTDYGVTVIDTVVPIIGARM